jgi:IS1 family transposase
MNKLPLETRVQILSMLVEGSSMRSAARVADVSINTVSKLLIDAGTACANFHHERVQGVRSKRVQCDEIWSFCYAKAKNVAGAKAAPYGAGDVWTWTAIDAESKLIVSWMVGRRDADAAELFMDDLQGRLASRVQLTTDGLHAYLDAVAGAFGEGVDYAMLVKMYGESPESAKGRYSPAECIGCRKEWISGNPDKAHVSTSYVERHNLTMRMSMRRFTRLTNAFSKKIDNHCHALALYFVWYNFCRINKAVRMSPAMAAGLTDTLMDMTDIANMVEAAAPKPQRGPYGTSEQRAERDRLAEAARIEAADIIGIKTIIRDVWALPADLLPEELMAFAKELRDRIAAGEAKEALYLRASLVQVHDMGIPLSPAHRTLVDRVYALLGRENSK